MQQQIREGVWPLNSRIPTEMELAAMLGVGRSTIREATQSMVKTGILEAAAGRGTFVRSRNAVNSVLSEYLSHQPLVDLLGLRRALEVEAAGLAAERRTEQDLTRLRRSIDMAVRQHAEEADLPDGPAHDGPADAARPAPSSAELPTPGSFHADLFAAANNELLTELYQAAITVVRRAVLSELLIPAPANERDVDHQLIFDAVAAGDVEAARTAAGEHSDRDFRVAGEPPATDSPAMSISKPLTNQVVTPITAPIPIVPTAATRD